MFENRAESRNCMISLAFPMMPLQPVQVRNQDHPQARF